MYGPGSKGLLGPKWDFLSVSLLALGIGSFLFHASMKYALEFVDELSMLLLAWSMLQAALTARQTPVVASRITWGLTVFFLGFAAFHVFSAQIIYQVIVFLLSITAIMLRNQYIFHWAKPPLPRPEARDWNRRIWQAFGISMFGYLLWNIDLELCHVLRSTRAQIGLPWAWLLELHGWWHILTAIGADRSMNVAREIRDWLERDEAATGGTSGASKAKDQ
jgi:dihydroceramidase